jgi:hypothetical protein
VLVIVSLTTEHGVEENLQLFYDDR